MCACRKPLEPAHGVTDGPIWTILTGLLQGAKVMRPSELVRLKAVEIRALTARYPTLAHPRVFGSAARGDDRPDSDIDILVDALDGATLFHIGGLMEELKELLGVKVDVMTPGDFPPRVRQQVLNEARPI